MGVVVVVVVVVNDAIIVDGEPGFVFDIEIFPIKVTMLSMHVSAPSAGLPATTQSSYSYNLKLNIDIMNW